MNKNQKKGRKETEKEKTDKEELSKKESLILLEKYIQKIRSITKRKYK